MINKKKFPMEWDAKSAARMDHLSLDFVSLGQSLSKKSVLVREVKELVRLNFSLFSYIFEPRECNSVAHALGAIGQECSGHDLAQIHVFSLLCSEHCN